MFIYSPRHRYACRPSLRLRRKEGEDFFFCSMTVFLPSFRRRRREGGPAQRRPGEPFVYHAN
jgi:hypothetical protein